MRQIILSDASKLTKRQETDTIDIVDELRYEINKAEHVSTNIREANMQNNDPIQLMIDRDKKLDLLERILEELGLEC